MSKRRLAAVVLLAPMMILAASCGSSSNTKAGSTQKPSAGGGDNGIAAAKARTKAALVRPTKIEVTEPIGAPVPKGKTVDWIQCSIPACTQLGVGLKGATDVLGWKLNIVDAGISPESVANAWARVAAERPDVVIGAGYPRVVFEQSLKKLAAEKVDVVLIDVTDPAKDGITAVIQGANVYRPSGALMADWVLSDGGKNADTLLVTTSAYPVVGLRAKGFSEEYKKLCPDCTIDSMEAQVGDFGDKLNTQVVGYLQAHPKVNYVAAGVSDMVTGLNSALQGAGLADRVRVISNDINPALEQDIRNGGALKALTQLENVNMMWQAIDVVARKFAGKPYKSTAEAKSNMWIATKDNIGSFKEPYPLVEDYEAQYKALWGV